MFFTLLCKSTNIILNRALLGKRVIYFSDDSHQSCDKCLLLATKLKHILSTFL